MGQFDSVMRNEQTRRRFLQSMAVVGGMGVLAACRKDVQSGGSGSSAAASAIPPITEEAGELNIHEWAGYDAKWLWRDYAKAGYPDPTFSFLTNTEGVIAKTAGGFYWDLTHPEIGYIQDYLDLGAIQPWDTSLISNFPKLDPTLQETGQIERRAVRDRARLGLLRRDHPNRRGRPLDQLLQLPVRRRARRSHLVVRHTVDPPQAHVVLGLESDPLDACPRTCRRRRSHDREDEEPATRSGSTTRRCGTTSQGNVWAAYSWPDTYVVLKADQRCNTSAQGRRLTWAEGLILRADTENYHHAHEYADAWASVEVGQRLVSTWGYGHSNTDVDLAQIDPDVVEVFGLDDLETALSSGIFDPTNHSEPSTTAPGTRSRRLRASRVSP